MTSWLGFLEESGPSAVATEQERARDLGVGVGRVARSSIRLLRSSSAVSASRTWNWTVWPTRTMVGDGDPARVVGAHHVADEEVTPTEGCPDTR